MISENSTKGELIQRVFSKAVDVTLQSLGPNDLKSVFPAEQREELGANLNGILVQSLGQMKARMEGQFRILCNESQIDRKLDELDKHSIANNSLGSEPSVGVLVANVEEAIYDKFIEQLTAENKSLKRKHADIQEKIDEQLQSVTEEAAKLNKLASQID